MFANFPNPDYHPYNYAEVYRQHLAYDGDPAVIALIHGALGRLLRPTISFGPGVEERLRPWLAQGRPLVFLADHQHYLDHLVDAAATHQNDSLRPIGERGFPLAKVEYLDTREGSPPQDVVISVLYRLLKAWPAYRPQDLDRILQPTARYLTSEQQATFEAEHQERLRTAVRDTNLAMIAAGVERLSKGGVLLPDSPPPDNPQNIIHGYGEGTRKLNDWTVVTPIFGGFSRMLVEASKLEGIQPGLLVAARSYGVTKQTDWRDMDWRRPHLHFGLFTEGPFERKADTTELIQWAMQLSLNEAHARTTDGPRHKAPADK